MLTIESRVLQKAKSSFDDAPACAGQEDIDDKQVNIHDIPEIDTGKIRNYYINDDGHMVDDWQWSYNCFLLSGEQVIKGKKKTLYDLYMRFDN